VTAGRDRLAIVVAGMLAGVPFHGGATWAVLQYVLGLRRLGHEVLFVEETAPGDGPLAGSPAGRYFAAVAGRFGLDGTSALLRSGTTETVGLPHDALRRAARRSDLLLNLSGVLRDPALVESIPVRAYVDLDPAFTQLWATEGLDVGLAGHTRHVTVGLELGAASCAVPTCGLQWITTLPPVVLDLWTAASGVRTDAFTTVANWRSYGSVERDGVPLGQKAHSMRALIDLPRRTGDEFRLALAIDPAERADLRALEANGWRILDPAGVAGTPDAYRTFVRGSRAELGVAKSGYALSGCGWFSERSACYLASGRPVVAQDTGFSRHLPTGRGLLAFSTGDGAVEAVHDVRSRYAAHARCARSLAEELFDSDRVLGRLLEAVA